MKQPIAMRCTKKQFKSIKPKLQLISRIGNLTGAFEEYQYLTNNYLDKSEKIFDFIGIESLWEREHQNNIHEEWNEKIFLEACGIETEKTFSITESQIKELSESLTTLCVKERLNFFFPEAFESEVKLEVGKWYKGSAVFDSLIFILEIEKSEKCNIIHYYGFTHESFKGPEYTNTIANNVHEKSLKEATEQEVFEALKNEAVKRYHKGTYIESLKNTGGGVVDFNNSDPVLYGTGDFWIPIKNGRMCCVFYNGQWAEIIESITLSEAEQQLGKKIIV